MEARRTNATFRILSALAILFVVAGHADYAIFDMGGLFPYYSFHVAVFLFISGYFYEESDQENIGIYIKRKCKRLLLPYFAWNLFYGILAMILRGGGFAIGDAVNLKTLLVDPFLGGHQYGWNFPAWFVPALFVVEVLNVCGRRVLETLHLHKEWLVLSGCLLAGIVTVWLAIGGHVWGYYKFPGRILFMLPVYQMGHFYKKRLEKYDTLPHSIYFGVVLAVQLVITYCCGGLAYSTVWCTSFANGPIVPYLTTITGIAFWLRIAKILSPLLDRMKGVEWLGRNTYAVMMHHIAGFMLLKGICCILSMNTVWCADFDRIAFLTDIGYIYVPGGVQVFKWLYLAAGIGVPFCVQYGKAWVGRCGKTWNLRLGKRGAFDAVKMDHEILQEMDEIIE